KQRFFFVLEQQIFHALGDTSLFIFIFLLQSFVNLLNRAEGLNERRRRLLADAFYADDVVRRIAAQTLVVRQKLGHKAETLDNARFVVENRVLDSLAQGVDLHSFLVDELHRVHVARSDDDFNIFVLLRQVDNRSQDVIGFKSRARIERNTPDFKYFLGAVDLRDEIVINLLARALVGFIRFVSMRRLRKIKAGNDIVGRQIFDELDEHCRKTEESAGRLAGRGRKLWQCVIRAMNNRVRVEENQSFLAG